MTRTPCAWTFCKAARNTMTSNKFIRPWMEYIRWDPLLFLLLRWAMMRRRTLLQLPAWAALQHAKTAGFQLSVRVEPLFPGKPLTQQMAKVAEAGYPGFEFGNWRAEDPARITQLKRQLGLECVCIVGNIGVNPKGMGLCDPAERDGFLAEI